MTWLTQLLDRVLSIFPRLMIIAPDETGVRYTPGIVKGIHVTSLVPGWWAYWPLIQDIETIRCKTQVVDLRPQSITTKDDQELIISGAIKYRVISAQKALLEVYDYDKNIQTLALGVIAKFANQKDYNECKSIKDLEAELLRGVREAAAGFGLKIMQVYITDLCKAKSFRILGETQIVPIQEEMS